MNYTEIEIEGMKEILQDKEEEIKKLKSDLSLVIKERDDNIEQNKKLKEYNRRLKQGNEDLKEQNKELKDDLLSYIRRNEDLREQNSYRNKIVDIIPQDEKSVAEETIKDLQERIRFLEQCLDNKEKVNKSLREENKRYKDLWDSEEI